MDLFENYDCIVFTEIHTSIDDIIFWNNKLWSLNKATILSQVMGLYGYAFSDFGENHILRDATGEKQSIFNIFLIEKKIGNADPW